MGDDDNGVRVRNGIVNLEIGNEANRNQNGGRHDFHANFPFDDGLNDQEMRDIDEFLEDPPNQNLEQNGLLNQPNQRNEVGGRRLGDQGVLGAARPNQGQQMPVQNAVGAVRQDVVPRQQRQNINPDAVGNRGRQDNRANRGAQPPADGNQVRHNAGNQGRQDNRAGEGQPPADEMQIRNNSNRGSRGTRAGQNRRRYTAPRLNPYERDLKNVAQYFVEVALSCTSRTRANLQRERAAREREEEDDQEN